MQAVRWVTHPWKEAGLWRSSSPALAHPVATRLQVLTAARAARPLAFAATMELGQGGPDQHQLTRHAKLTAPASSAPELKQILLFLLQVFNLQSFGKVDIERLAIVLNALPSRFSEVPALQLRNSKALPW